MSNRWKSLAVGVALGAAIGALLGWLVSDADAHREPTRVTGLQAISPGDYIKIGIAVLTLAREFGQMLRKP
jgi:hypothetical protein